MCSLNMCDMPSICLGIYTIARTHLSAGNTIILTSSSSKREVRTDTHTHLCCCAEVSHLPRHSPDVSEISCRMFSTLVLRATGAHPRQCASHHSAATCAQHVSRNSYSTSNSVVAGCSCLSVRPFRLRLRSVCAHRESKSGKVTKSRWVMK